jgi:hypothetical protein
LLLSRSPLLIDSSSLITTSLSMSVHLKPLISPKSTPASPRSTSSELPWRPKVPFVLHWSTLTVSQHLSKRSRVAPKGRPVMTCATKGNRFLYATGLALKILNTHLPTPPRRRSFPPYVLEILAEFTEILSPLLTDNILILLHHRERAAACRFFCSTNTPSYHHVSKS